MFNRIFKNSKKMETKDSVDQNTEAIKANASEEGFQEDALLEDFEEEKHLGENGVEGSEEESESSEVQQESIETIKADYDNQINELKDKYLRLRAEFDNFKRRTVREKLDMMKTASRDTMTVMLPILDDFDRAEKSAKDNGEEQLPGGVQIVVDKMRKTLEQKGLKPMETNGEVFNPELHEAITEIPAPNEDLKGKVIDTVERGYYLNDVIIRYAKVVVGK